ncbi:MAG: phosphonopyruvate decarboxylase [Propionibacteriales bacterium]|nr:phosphonopyruvate decarboxylase [Propionibacteriales bacterium]
MLDPAWFVRLCGDQGITLYTGVPDSLLKQLNAEIMHTLPRRQHIIAANEGAAVGIAIGHYLRTATPGLVYLQNSGFGNAVNPLMSLADPDVYGIPMLVLVGWRGQVGVPDEPQHVKQGRVMDDLLDALDLPWAVLPKESADAAQCLKTAVTTAVERSSPYILMVEKGTFADASNMDLGHKEPTEELPSREEALVALAEAVGDGVTIVSTTGMLSRELFEHRQRSGTDGSRDFLTVGGMGHACSIALGLAMNEPDREVWCLDGDGAALMHLGSLAVIADHAPSTYFHVVFNNGVHDSVGAQPTSISAVDVPATARALGYRYARATADISTISDAVAQMRANAGPALLELRVRPGNRPGIGRPTRTPRESKQTFMSALRAGST